MEDEYVDWVISRPYIYLVLLNPGRRWRGYLALYVRPGKRNFDRLGQHYLGVL